MKMIKKEEKKDDGRYIIFYEFDEEKGNGSKQEVATEKENKDV